MSTKIYYGHRILLGRLNEFIDWIRPRIFDIAEKHVRQLMEHVREELVNNEFSSGHWISKEAIRFSEVKKLLIEAAKSKERSPGIDMSYSINIWIFEGRAYIIPIGEEDFKNLDYPDWVEDFCYFNNTDKLDSILEEQWKEREETWKKINLGKGISSYNARRLQHSVIDFSSLYGDFDAEWELRERILGKEN